jgi:hypothetical protein
MECEGFVVVVVVMLLLLLFLLLFLFHQPNLFQQRGRFCFWSARTARVVLVQKQMLFIFHWSIHWRSARECCNIIFSPFVYFPLCKIIVNLLQLIDQLIITKMSDNNNAREMTLLTQQTLCYHIIKTISHQFIYT